MKYINIEESLNNNGNRHLGRALYYIYSNYPDKFWEGSLKKALKNYKKANELSLNPFEYMIINDISNKLANQIFNVIVNGK